MGSQKSRTPHLDLYAFILLGQKLMRPKLKLIRAARMFTSPNSFQVNVSLGEQESRTLRTFRHIEYSMNMDLYSIKVPSKS